MSSLMNYLNVKAYTYKETLKKKTLFFSGVFAVPVLLQGPQRLESIHIDVPLFLTKDLFS